MIFLYKSNNNIISLITEYLINNNFKTYIIEDINQLDNIKEVEQDSIFIYFYDKYLDVNINLENTVEKIITICKLKKIKFIYIDSVDLFGLTEKTSVIEDDNHIPFSKIGKTKSILYKKLFDNKIDFCILRIPDILGKECNYFFNDIFNNSSNFIKWTGLTNINHEYIFDFETIDVFGNILKSLKSKTLVSKEYNFSGHKYTIEQIAATIDELTGINIKINKISKFSLFLKSKKSPLAKVLYETCYLYEKPVFLNSKRYEKEFINIDDVKQLDIYLNFVKALHLN